MVVISRGLVFFLLLSILPAIPAFDDSDSTNTTKLVLSSCEYVLEDGLMVRYQTLQDDPWIHWELRYEANDSEDDNVWMGLGFAPNGTMVGSTVVIGVPQSIEDEEEDDLSPSADVYYLAARTTQGVAPLPEGGTNTTAIQFVITDDTFAENNTTAPDSSIEVTSLPPTVGPTANPTKDSTRTPTTSPSLGTTTPTPPPVVEEPAKTTLSPTVAPINPPPTLAPTKRTYQAPVAAPSFFDEWRRQLEEIDMDRHRILHTQHHRLELDFSDRNNTSSLKFQSSPDWHLEHDLIYAIGRGPILGYHAQRGLIPRSVLLENATEHCIFYDDDTSSPPTAMPSTSAPSSSTSSSPPTFTSTETTTNVDRLNQIKEEITTTKGIDEASFSSSSSSWPRRFRLSLLCALSTLILLASHTI